MTVQKEKIWNYSRIIDDLERHKLVTIFPSTMILATDPRKFILKNSKEEYEVDCLGTTLCEDITEMVLSLWKTVSN
jgi:hypothetical protein